jgi:hypothetical protein
VKNSYIILSNQHITGYFEQKYNIVRFTQDTLILAPVGKDIFKLSQPDEENQYVFVNSMLTYKFVKLHFETMSNYSKFDGESVDDAKIIYTLDIDSAKNSKVTAKDKYSSEPQIRRSPASKKDYERLMKILSSYDLDSFPDENVRTNDNRNPILEIWYNDQKKIFKGCIPIGYSKLEDFMWEYIALRTSFSDVMKVRR